MIQIFKYNYKTNDYEEIVVFGTILKIRLSDKTEFFLSEGIEEEGNLKITSLGHAIEISPKAPNVITIKESKK